ncbi:MAG: NAD-dependent epimerase/dehydratase family protein [Bryobacteraceae bacterium]
MRVLITGAQGCIGAWVAKSLVDRGIEVLLYDLTAEPLRLRMIMPAAEVARLRVAVGSVEDTEHLKRLVREEEITHIVHLAAVLMPFCQAQPVRGAMINVIGTLNVFEAARDAGRPVRVVYASSAAVWGPEEAYGEGKLNDDDPLKPATHYGVFKQANEGSARIFYQTNGISSIGLRPWTVYGVGRDQGLTADPTLAMRAVAALERYQIRLSGYMDLQLVEDVAGTFVECLLSTVEGAHVFNIEGWVTSMGELVNALEKLRPEAQGFITFSGPQVPVAFRVDGSQLRSKIARIPRTPLQEGIRKTVEQFERLRAGQAAAAR